MTRCPCDSGLAFDSCCEPYILGHAIAPTPEALMRSRYSAYTLANVNYIKATMRDNALQYFNISDAQHWAERIQWRGLSILNAPDPDPPHTGFVEFIARYKDNGRAQRIHEVSEFKRFDGHWYYVDGHQQ